MARERDATAAAIAETRDEIHAATSEYLREESKGKERGVMFEHLHAEVMELEAEIVALKREERARARHRGAQGERGEERSAAAAKTAKYKEQAAEVRHRDAVAHDLKKRRRDITDNIKEFEKLYEMVKEQRNAFVTLITSSRRSVAELREKLKILANEIDILRGESADKETTLFRTHQDHAKARAERDSARAEMNKARVVFRERREELDEQISLIDSPATSSTPQRRRCCACVEGTRTRWSGAIERAWRSSIETTSCASCTRRRTFRRRFRGEEIELRKREDEIRALTIEIADAERSVEVARRTMTRVPGLDEQVASLQAQLLVERREAERLSAELEAPENKSRWRKLEGQVPDAEELAAKLESLRARLDDKEDQLAEKDLVLDEVTRLAGASPNAGGGEPRGYPRARVARQRLPRENSRRHEKSYGHRLRTLHVPGQRGVAGGGARSARGRSCDGAERAASGEAPDEDAEREWARRVRSEETASAAARDREARRRRRRARTGPRRAAPRRDRTRTSRRIQSQWACRGRTARTRRSNRRRRGRTCDIIARRNPGRSSSRERVTNDARGSRRRGHEC